jgi:hypothetical protein
MSERSIIDLSMSDALKRLAPDGDLIPLYPAVSHVRTARKRSRACGHASIARIRTMSGKLVGYQVYRSRTNATA